METRALQMFTSTVKNIDEDIFIEPLCDFFKIDWINQQKKMKNDPILAKCLRKNTSKSLFGDNYPRVCLEKRGFLRWIQILNPNIIDKHLRDSFIVYQELISDYLFGAAEEQKMIGSLNAKLQNLKLDYSVIGNEIRITQQKLFRALNNRYQYSLPFAQQKKTIEFSD
jgi:hypothetical protein